MNDASQATNRKVGLVRRLLAISYDSLLIVALWMLVTALFNLLNHGLAMPGGSAMFQLHRLTLFAITIGFFTAFWTHGGQTLGMQAWRIKVVKADGSGMQMIDSLKRALAALLSLAPAGLGFWWSLFDRDSLTWHDRISKTRLIRSDQ